MKILLLIIFLATQGNLSLLSKQQTPLSISPSKGAIFKFSPFIIKGSNIVTKQIVSPNLNLCGKGLTNVIPYAINHNVILFEAKELQLNNINGEIGAFTKNDKKGRLLKKVLKKLFFS